MYLFDTSALAAHCFHEPGWELVEELIVGRRAWVSAVSWLEFRIRLERYEGAEERLVHYRQVLAGTLDVTAAVADVAYLIRRASPKRVPSIDALVAATAKVHGLHLVHRDGHLAEIPRNVLDQTMLPLH